MCCEKVTLAPLTSSIPRRQLLEKNYAVLISMAPISTETEEMTRVVPRHFGPPLPEVHLSPARGHLIMTVAIALTNRLYRVTSSTRCGGSCSCITRSELVLPPYCTRAAHVSRSCPLLFWYPPPIDRMHLR